MNEYPIAPAAKAFGYLFAAASFLGGIYLLYLAFHGSALNSNTPALIFGIVLIPLGLSVYRGVNRLLVTVDDKVLTVRDLFRNNEIELSEIDGYRHGDKNAFLLVPKDGGKAISIPSNLRDRKMLIQWIKERYEDVDARARDAETEMLLEDDRYGQTREEREIALKKAKLSGFVTTIAALVLFFWYLFYPQPYELIMVLIFAAPPVAVYLTWSNKGLLRLSSKKSSPYPTALLLFLFPILSGFINAIQYRVYDFPLLAVLTIGTMAAVLSLLAGTVMRAALAEAPQKALAIVLLVVFSGVYSYGLLIYTNCHYDHSEAQIIRVQVTDKRVAHGKSTTYYLVLAPWGKYVDEKKVSVNKSFYAGVNVNDSVGVHLNKGKWGISWYRLYRN